MVSSEIGVLEKSGYAFEWQAFTGHSSEPDTAQPAMSRRQHSTAVTRHSRSAASTKGRWTPRADGFSGQMGVVRGWDSADQPKKWAFLGHCLNFWADLGFSYPMLTRRVSIS